MHINALARLGTIFLAAFLSTSSAFAVVVTNIATEAQLEAAIIVANANNDDDVFNLTANIPVTGAFINTVFNGPNGVTPIGPDNLLGTPHSVIIVGNSFTISRVPAVLGTAYRLFEVVEVLGVGGHLILSNVKIQGFTPGAFDGGAVLINARASFDSNRNTQFLGNNSGANGGAVAILSNGQSNEISDTIFSGNSAANVGGALAISISATATLITRSEFSGNSALLAGAILVGGTLTTLSDSNLFNNSAVASGGAIWVPFGGVLNNILNTNFTDNSTPFGSGGVGGAIAVSGLVEVIDGSDFINNTSVFGAALWVGDFLSPPLSIPGHVNEITDTLFKSNDAGQKGGAISASQTNSVIHPTLIDAIRLSRFEENVAALQGGGAIHVSAAKIALIETTTFLANGGGTDPQVLVVGGGAILLEGADLGTVRDSLFALNATLASGGAILLLRNGAAISSITVLGNSTFSGNTAGSFGGAISFGILREPVIPFQVLLPSIIVFFSNNTVADNVAGISGGGLFLGADDGVGTIFNFWSSIVALNIITGGGGGPDVANDPDNPIVNEAYNLIGNNSGSTFVAGLPNANLSYVGTAAAPVDPRLGPLADNGGPTQTRALLTAGPASIAIDHGANPLLFLFDQRGSNFLRTSGPQTDIGAYEVQQACPGCPLCPVCPRRECSKCHKDHDRGDNDNDDDGNGNWNRNGNRNNRGEEGITSKGRVGRGPRGLSLATPSTDAPVVAKNGTPSVSVEARQVKNGDAGSTTSSNVDSLEQAGGCSSISGVGQSSTNLTLMLLSLLAGFRAIRSRKAKGILPN